MLLTSSNYYLWLKIVQKVHWISNPWVVKLSWLANACSHPLLTAGDLDALRRSGWPSCWCVIRVCQWVCACKITSLCVQRLQLMPPWLSQNWFVHFDLVTLKSRSNPTLLYIHVRCTPSRSNPRQLLHCCQVHPRCKFGDRKSVACRDKHFLWCPENPLK